MLTSDLGPDSAPPPPQRSLERFMGIDAVTTTRDGYLDGVRALAVTMVLATHAWQFAGWPTLGGAEVVFVTGYLWIDVFFILSACLLARPWFAAELTGRPRPPFGTFLIRRIRRIAPAYYVSVIVVLAAFAGTRALPTSAIEGSLGFWNLGSILLFVQNYVPVASRNFNGLNSPWWTLSVEMTWYLVLPLAVTAFLRRRWRIALPVAVAVSLIWVYLSLHALDSIVEFLRQSIDARAELRTGVHATADTIRNRLVSEIPAFTVDFAVGLALARLEIVRRQRPEATQRWTSMPIAVSAFIAGVVVIVAMELALTRAPGEDLTGYSRVPFALGLGLCLFGMAYGPRALRRPFDATPVRYVGWVSYGVYLYHVPILAWLSQHITPTNPIRALVAYISITFALALAAGTVSWLVVERAFLVRNPRPAWAPKVIAATLAASLIGTYVWVTNTRPDPLLLPFDGFTANRALTGEKSLRDALAAGVLTVDQEKVLRECGASPDSVGQTTGGNGRAGWVVVGTAFECASATRSQVATTHLGEVYAAAGFAHRDPSVWITSSNSPNPDFPVRLVLQYSSGRNVVAFTVYAPDEPQALHAYPELLTASYPVS